MLKNKDKIVMPLVSVALGLLLAIIILLATGKSPIGFLINILKAGTGFDVYNPQAGVNLRLVGEYMVSTMPIVLTGLSIAFAYRTGMFNIGAEGQVIMGSLASAAVAILFPMPGVIHAIVCVIAGALAGALWAFIPGILKARFNIQEVVVGIMLNYVALSTSNFFLLLLPGSTKTQTVHIPQSASLKSEFLSGLTNNSRLHWGFIVVIVALILFWFIIEKTAFGYGLRATGFNKDAAEYAGIKVKRNIILSMMISGAFAGAAGAIVVQGTFGFGRVLSAMENLGFDGISVALVGGSTALGSLLAGLLFGLLSVSNALLQLMGIPKEIVNVLSSSIVFFVAIQLGLKELYKRFIGKRKKKEEQL